LSPSIVAFNCRLQLSQWFVPWSSPLTTENSQQPQLSAARPEGQDVSQAYLPRVPWKLVGIGALLFAVVVGGFWLKEYRKAMQLRAEILKVRDQQLAAPVKSYNAFRAQLERLVMQSASQKSESYIDKRLNLHGLHTGQGVYLRLQAKDAQKPLLIAQGATAMTPDLIPKCLGFEALDARALYTRGSWLQPEWIEETRTQSNVMKLRVQGEMLSRHVRDDLRDVEKLLESDWLLLVLEQGPSRKDDPVDVFLWDMNRGTRLLQTRAQARGLLLPVRIQSQGKTSGRAIDPNNAQGLAAADCSIASQIKELAGFPQAQMQSSPLSEVVPVTASPTVPAPGAAPAAIPATAH
jgi:hypothetical protein